MTSRLCPNLLTIRLIKFNSSLTINKDLASAITSVEVYESEITEQLLQFLSSFSLRKLVMICDQVSISLNNKFRITTEKFVCNHIDNVLICDESLKYFKSVISGKPLSRTINKLSQLKSLKLNSTIAKSSLLKHLDYCKYNLTELCLTFKKNKPVYCGELVSIFPNLVKLDIDNLSGRVSLFSNLKELSLGNSDDINIDKQLDKLTLKMRKNSITINVNPNIICYKTIVGNDLRNKCVFVLTFT